MGIVRGSIAIGRVIDRAGLNDQVIFLAGFKVINEGREKIAARIFAQVPGADSRSVFFQEELGQLPAGRILERDLQLIGRQGYDLKL